MIDKVNSSNLKDIILGNFVIACYNGKMSEDLVNLNNKKEKK